MRNRYKGTCYHCNATVNPGDGHFERHKGHWRTIHAGCVFELRKQKLEAKFTAKEVQT